LRRAIEIHPQFVEAGALLAQSHLMEALQSGNRESMHIAARVAQQAREVDPQSYDAAITLAEVQTAAGRAGLGSDWLEQALQTLGQARHLPGCQNRVNLMIASARLALLQQQAARGADIGPSVREIVIQCERQRSLDWDSSAWEEIRETAVELLHAPTQ